MSQVFLTLLFTQQRQEHHITLLLKFGKDNSTPTTVISGL